MNDNGEDNCPCPVCAVARVVDEALSENPTTKEVINLFRAFSVSIGEIAKMNSEPFAVLQLFTAVLGKTLNEMQVASIESTVHTEDVPPPSTYRH